MVDSRFGRVRGREWLGAPPSATTCCSPLLVEPNTIIPSAVQVPPRNNSTAQTTTGEAVASDSSASTCCRPRRRPTSHQARMGSRRPPCQAAPRSPSDPCGGHAYSRRVSTGPSNAAYTMVVPSGVMAGAPGKRMRGAGGRAKRASSRSALDASGARKRGQGRQPTRAGSTAAVTRYRALTGETMGRATPWRRERAPRDGLLRARTRGRRQSESARSGSLLEAPPDHRATSAAGPLPGVALPDRSACVMQGGMKRVDARLPIRTHGVQVSSLEQHGAESRSYLPALSVSMTLPTRLRARLPGWRQPTDARRPRPAPADADGARHRHVPSRRRSLAMPKAEAS